MNASYHWLKSLVDIPLSPARLRDLLTERCATVDGVTPLRADLAPIVVARVVEAAPHPDSDRLSVTKVDAGGGALVDVVCGAPNVRAGKLYPFAPVGTVMPDGLKIEKRKIRGATSQGMLCSARELGLGESHEGILELDLDVAPGTPLLRAMPIGDSVFDIDVTPNRPDLLSHFGLAREIAAALGKPLAAPKPPEAPEPPAPVRDARSGDAGGVRVMLEDPEGAPRYLGVTIRGVTVGPSPAWLVERLAAVGGRSINNVVDATNFMLHGFGQPMHAFDAAKLGGGAIVVRRARPGERLRTLDGVERALDPSMTVIADAARAQALAGVMGGQESEVSESTTDVFLEVANFDPVRTRATRRALGISTDASYRFERGVDIDAAGRWLAYAVRLIVHLAGGRVDGAPVDLYPAPHVPRAVTLRAERVTRLLGAPVPAPEVATLLGAVGFGVTVIPGTEMLRGNEEMRVVVPAWRPDVLLEADVIEEVARLRGYDSFPADIRPYRPGTVPDAPMWATAARLRDALVAEGLLETRPLPFVKGDDRSHVRVANPIAENEAHLRTSVLDTLARRAEHNLAHMRRDIRLFEIGAAWRPSDGRLPHEETRVAALLMGDRRPPHFTDPRPPQVDEWDAKGLAERIAVVAYPAGSVRVEPAADPAALWELVADGGDGERSGNGARTVLGHVRRVALDAPVWAAPAFGVELTLETLDSSDVAPEGRSAWRAAEPTSGARHLSVRDLPQFPAAEFDLALLVPNDVPAARVETVMRAAAGEMLERLALFDEYRGSGVPAGHRSVAWRLTFRHPERTLRDKEVEARRERLVRALESELGIRARTS